MTRSGMPTTPSTIANEKSAADAVPDSAGRSKDISAWQDAKIRAGLKAADEGRFATPEAVAAVVQKYSRNA